MTISGNTWAAIFRKIPSAAGLIVCLVLLGVSATPVWAGRPNLIVMMTDDQRADAMSCAGNLILQTPAMDRLAAEGARFRNMFVTNSLCAPSRASLLTGFYSHTHGVIDNKNRQIPADLPLVSDLLRAAGYQVAFCGKSHVAGALRDRTWDYYFGFEGQGDYLRPRIAEGVDGPDRPYTGYMDDIVTGKAVEWLSRAAGDDRPFCLFLFFKAPHRSWQRAPRHADLFQGVTVPSPDTWDLRAAGSPGKPRAFHEATNVIGAFDDVPSLDKFALDYYATLTAVDENVNRVLNWLDAAGEAEETAVFYTSDNGFFMGEWQAFDKRFMHEPSIRVPLLVRYPKLIEAGSVLDQQALNIDLAPTLLELAEAPPRPELHGRSLVPLWRDKPVEWRKDWLYEYYEYPGPHSVKKNRGIRTEQYKYIHYYEAPEEFELYDLEADPQERDNLYGRAEMAEVTSNLASRLEELRRETGD